jgi:hypothetical protein
VVFIFIGQNVSIDLTGLLRNSHVSNFKETIFLNLNLLIPSVTKGCNFRLNFGEINCVLPILDQRSPLGPNLG